MLQSSSLAARRVTRVEIWKENKFSFSFIFTEIFWGLGYSNREINVFMWNVSIRPWFFNLILQCTLHSTSRKVPTVVFSKIFIGYHKNHCGKEWNCDEFFHLKMWGGLKKRTMKTIKTLNLRLSMYRLVGGIFQNIR